jgi:hypothetical protein
MAVVFSYSGTSPATVLTFSRDPDDWDRERKYMSPSILAAGGEDRFTKDKSIIHVPEGLRWERMKAADWTSLQAFLTAVNGGAASFTYFDPLGSEKAAQIWNAAEIQSVQPYYGAWDVLIELLILAVYTLSDYLAYEDGIDLMLTEDGNFLVTE